MLQFKKRYNGGQKDRPNRKDRAIVIEVEVFNRLVQVINKEGTSYKEAASRLIEAGIDLYEQQCYNEPTTE